MPCLVSWRSILSAMFATIWMCTHEWSLISRRATAFTFATCHHALISVSALTRVISVRSFRLPRAGTLIFMRATASAGVRRISCSASSETGDSIRSSVSGSRLTARTLLRGLLRRRGAARAVEEEQRDAVVSVQAAHVRPADERSLLAAVDEHEGAAAGNGPPIVDVVLPAVELQELLLRQEFETRVVLYAAPQARHAPKEPVGGLDAGHDGKRRMFVCCGRDRVCHVRMAAALVPAARPRRYRDRDDACQRGGGERQAELHCAARLDALRLPEARGEQPREDDHRGEREPDHVPQREQARDEEDEQRKLLECRGGLAVPRQQPDRAEGEAVERRRQQAGRRRAPLGDERGEVVPKQHPRVVAGQRRR